MNQDPIEHLIEEHQDIMAQIADLRKSVQLLAVHGEQVVSETLPVFGRIGAMMASQLDMHRRKEDEVLFPALEAIFGTEGTPTSVMREEHEAIHAQGVVLRQTLAELNEVEHPAIEAGAAQLRSLAASGGSAQALRATGERIIQLLDMHFAKEEQILFPMARQLLGPEQWQQVAIQFENLSTA